MHGFSQLAADLNAQDRYDLAAYQYLVGSIGMRGRDGASGAQDASGREIQDIVDAIAWLRANDATADQSLCGIVGYSGGGGNALAAICKFPDTFSFWVSYFGISDYGYDPSTGWYAQTTGGNQSTLTTWIGNHSDLTNYRARDVREAIVMAMQLEASPQQRLWLYADHDDTSVPPVHTDNIAASIAAAGLPRVYGPNNRASQSGDAIRYTHDLPHGSPGVRASYVDWATAAIALPAWTVKAAATCRVLGYMVTKRFSIWTGETLSPTPRASGGVKRVLDLTYDTAANTYTVTPLNGSCYVQVIQGSKTALQLVSATTVLTVV